MSIQIEGINEIVRTTAHNYASKLYNENATGYNIDGNPWDRLNRSEEIAQNQDFFKFAESISIENNRRANRESYIELDICRQYS